MDGNEQHDGKRGKKPETQWFSGTTGAGIGIGAALGAVFGIVMESIPVWAIFGGAIGYAVALAIDTAAKKKRGDATDPHAADGDDRG